MIYRHTLSQEIVHALPEKDGYRVNGMSWLQKDAFKRNYVRTVRPNDCRFKVRVARWGYWIKDTWNESWLPFLDIEHMTGLVMAHGAAGSTFDAPLISICKELNERYGND